MGKRRKTAVRALEAAIDMLQRKRAEGLQDTHALVALEVVRLQRMGLRAKLKDIGDRLGIRYTTVSRVSFELAERYGLVEYEDDKKDRRIKYLVVRDEKRVEQLIQARA